MTDPEKHVRLTHLHDPARNFLVRVCATVEEDESPGFGVIVPVHGSVRRACEECDAVVWYDPSQPVPVVEDVEFEAEVLLCIGCALLHQSLDDGPIKWAD